MRFGKPNKKTAALCLSAALGIASFSTGINAASLSKKIDVIYRNITVSYNNQVKTMTAEPFINSADNSVYVPLRAFSEMTGSEVKWDSVTNKVSVTGTDGTNTSTTAEITAKNYEIATLKQQLSIAEAKIKQLESTQTTTEKPNTPSSTINQETLQALTEKLQADYGSKNRVEWEFDVAEKNGTLVVNISYDSRYDGELFDRISERTLKTFTDSILSDIQKQFNKTVVTGVIEDSRYNSQKATFEATSTGKTSFISTASLYEDVTASLKRVNKTIKGLSFDLPVEDIQLEERSGALIFTAFVNLKPNSTTDLRNDWNAISDSASSKKAVEDFMFDLADDIAYEFDLDVEGYIRDEFSENIISTFDGRKVVLDNRQ